jgi:hypothetical protein
LLEGDLSCSYAAVVEEHETVLNSSDPVRNFREVVSASVFLAREAERAVVGGDDVQVSPSQARP